MKFLYARSTCRTSLIELSLVTKYEFQMEFVLFQFISTFSTYIYKYTYNMYEWMYMCVNSLNTLAQQKVKSILYCFMFTLLWSQFSFSHSIYIQVVAFACPLSPSHPIPPRTSWQCQFRCTLYDVLLWIYTLAATHWFM